MPRAPSNGEALLPIARRALTHWDLEERELRLISLSENAVFRLDASDGGTYIIRIHRPGYSSLKALESELTWTAALGEAGLDVPEAVHTRRGEGYATVSLDDGSRRHVGVVRWIEGTLLSAILDRKDGLEAIAGHYRRLGGLAARIHQQASGWNPSPGFVRRAWDADGLMGRDPLWGRFWELPQIDRSTQDLLVRVRGGLHSALREYGTDRRIFSLIHADLHADNVLVSGERMHVIDFDDAGFGWHMYELAITLFGAQRPDLPTLVDAVAGGYREVRPLSDADLERLPQFLLIRALALLGWMHGRPELGLEARIGPLLEYATARAEAFLSGRLEF